MDVVERHPPRTPAPSGRARKADIKGLRRPSRPFLRPRSRAITPPAPHAAAPLEPQAQHSA